AMSFVCCVVLMICSLSLCRFKTLGDKSKEAKSCLPHCCCGVQQVDGDLVMLSALWDKRRTALAQLEEQLQGLPALITDLGTITSGLAQLEGDFEEMESRMVYLETLCCQCEQQTVKQQHLKELESYKKKKRKELHAFEMELNSEHAQTVAHMEQLVQQKLKQKQKEYEEAFHQDMEKYLTSGFLMQRGNTTSTLHHSTAPPAHCTTTTTLQHHKHTTLPLSHCTTTSTLHHNTVPPPHCTITTLHHHCTAPPVHYATSCSWI
uniref:Uncharacterized protein n=1 Tax=Periophthalmus magnuspinnatus TaxID=409849 RepID=A0A3B4A952_9GOBI